MRAAYYTKFQGSIAITDVPEPEVVPHGVIIEVKASGLCLSDWHGWMGHDKDIVLPHVPGHELAGRIVEVGKDIRNWQTGARVTLPFVCGCGICPTCVQGDPQVCPDQFQPGFTHWGSFAKYVSIHYADTNLVALPESVDDVTAASLGCRFATSYRGIVDQGRVKEGEIVVVFGCGGIGLSAIMIAAAKGARVVAIDKKLEALDHASTVGATDFVLSDHNIDIPGTITEITKGGAHVTVDAIGHPQIVHDAIACLRRRGRHVQIGIPRPDEVNATVQIDKIIAYELELLGSHGMQAFRYQEMLEMIKTGELHPHKLVNQELTLEEGIKTLPLMGEMSGSGINVITSF